MKSVGFWTKDMPIDVIEQALRRFEYFDWEVVDKWEFGRQALSGEETYAQCADFIRTHPTGAKYHATICAWGTTGKGGPNKVQIEWTGPDHAIDDLKQSLAI